VLLRLPKTVVTVAKEIELSDAYANMGATCKGSCFKNQWRCRRRHNHRYCSCTVIIGLVWRMLLPVQIQWIWNVVSTKQLLKLVWSIKPSSNSWWWLQQNRQVAVLQQQRRGNRKTDSWSDGKKFRKKVLSLLRKPKYRNLCDLLKDAVRPWLYLLICDRHWKRWNWNGKSFILIHDKKIGSMKELVLFLKWQHQTGRPLMIISGRYWRWSACDTCC